MNKDSDQSFWAFRRCLRPAVSEIFDAADLIDRAANAHLAGQPHLASELIAAADLHAIREWIESLWGSVRDNPDQPQYHRFRQMNPEPVKICPELRDPVRMPNSGERLAIIERFGWNCAYCGIPLVHPNARKVLQKAYPEALRWGLRNTDKHPAFQCMTPEYDHVVPHCYGGSSDIANTVISCGPCNCGKFDRLLAHHGLIDPREIEIIPSTWDGLTRLLV